MYCSIYNSPVGKIKIIADNQNIIDIGFSEECKENPNKLSIECKKQLEQYFEGKRKIFDIKYRLIGTDFSCKVWNELSKIPYGKVVSYKDIAVRIGNEKAVRAVANAIGRNNLLIIIPCHRVIGSNGKLTGFSAYTEEKTGIEIKQELLNLEK